MQEDVNYRTIALSVKAAKLTARVIMKAVTAALRQIQKPPHGKQKIKSLMKQNVQTSTIPLDGDTRLFDRVARKWHVDYAFYKTGPGKYLLLFKSAQTDAITACFSEYTKLFMARDRENRTPIREQLEQFSEPTRPRERERTREAARDER